MTGPPAFERSSRGLGSGPLRQSADRLANAIILGEPMTAALGTDEIAVLAVVDESIEQLLSHPIRVVRFRGVPGSPLTLPRIVQELGASKRGGTSADDDELIVRVLAKPSGGEGRTLLVIEQAEVLPARTLAFLQVISTVFGARTPSLQLLFAGHPRFERLIEKDELSGIRDRLGTMIQVVQNAWWKLGSPQGSPP